MSCPDEETLLAFVDGTLGPTRRGRVEEHIDACTTCALLVADAARDRTQTPAPDGEEGTASVGAPSTVPWLPPLRAGRYEVREALGAGAMGYVYAAYDPELERRVALKFVRPGPVGKEASEGQQRLFREAQAIARLSHPNVVEVFEVAEVAGTMFVAMELVEGESLRRWLGDRPPRDDVLAAFEQAGRGLAAAHDAGIVHRDFKPENVLVGRSRDGALRVKVMDFGLARARTPESIDGSTRRRLGQDVPALALDMTAAGAVVGTPTYMAPEQHRGDPADERSDQYAFCVALYEAVFGQRPFGGLDMADLCRLKQDGQWRPIPRGTGIPRKLVSAIERGLSPDPDRRFGSVHELVEIISRARRPRPRLPWIAAAAVALLGGWWWIGNPTIGPRGCADVDPRLSRLWNDDRRREIEDAFSRTDSPYAAEAVPRVTAGLVAHADAWQSVRSDVCRAHRGEPDALLTDRQLQCLERHLPSFEAVLQVLEQADAATVRRGAQLVAALPDPTLCADESFVRSAVPPPGTPELAAEVLELRRRLAQVAANERAGRPHVVLDEAERLVEEAQAVDYPPVSAEALLGLGSLLETLGRPQEAAENLEAAYRVAIEEGDHALAARAATALVFVVGHQGAQLAKGQQWARFAEAALQRMGGDERAWARLDTNLATVLSDAGRFEDAIARYRSAIERLEAQEGNEVALGQALNGLASTQGRAGDLEAARDGLQLLVPLWQRALGPSHPSTTMAQNNLGNVLTELGELDEAHEVLARALASGEKTLGHEHSLVGDVLLNLGRVHARQGRLDEARRHYLEAIEVWSASLGEEHPHVAQALNNLGAVLMQDGEPTRALRRYDEAIALWERALGREHPRLVMALHGRGEVLVALDRLEEAEDSFRRALEIAQDAYGPSDPRSADLLLGLATVSTAKGDMQQAVQYLEQARDRLGDDPDPNKLEPIEAELAKLAVSR